MGPLVHATAPVLGAEAQPLLRLLRGWPLAVVETADAGRAVVAARDVAAGECVLEAAPLAVHMYFDARRRWCSCCARYARDRLRVECGDCGATFCSTGAHGAALHRSCRPWTRPSPRLWPRKQPAAAPATRGAACRGQSLCERVRGACGARRHVREDATLGEEERHLALLLLDALARQAAARAAPPYGNAPAGADDDADAGGRAVPPTLADAAALYAPDASTRSRYGLERWPAVWDAAVSVAVAAASAAGPPLEEEAEVAGEAALEALASADLSNSFALFDRTARAFDRAICAPAATESGRAGPSRSPRQGAIGDAAYEDGGRGVFVGAALFNHSCLPSLVWMHFPGPVLRFFALRPVAAGDELSIRYTDTAAETSERQAALRDYGFRCGCRRCSGEAEGEAVAWDEQHVCRCGNLRVAGGARLRGPGGAALPAPVASAGGCARCLAPAFLPRLPVD